jgi:glutaredoxin
MEQPLLYNVFPYPTQGVYTIYSKKDCIYCTKVKKLLEKEKTVLIECDSYLEENRDFFLETMDSITGREHRTFPFVFKDETFLGGHDDTVLYLNKHNQFISFTDEF